MERVMLREWTATDVFLASFLSCSLNVEPNFKFVRGRVVFVFSATDELYRAIAAFNSDEPIAALSFSETVKELRGRMMRIKHDEGRS
jgi:hypothetical protein